jgi:hypothetical protein
MDDLTTGLAKARKQPWLTRSTGVMFALVLICGGFLAGIKVQQAYGSSNQSTPGGGGGGNFPNRAGLQQQQPAAQQQQQQQQPLTGKIKLVDGTTLYLETADGRVVTVKTTQTTVVATQAQLKDLPPGASVTVVGTGTETVTASSIIKTD